MALAIAFSLSPHWSAQVQGGLMAAPFARYTLNLLTGFSLDRNLNGVVNRSFRQGSSLSVGVIWHARSPWNARRGGAGNARRWAGRVLQAGFLGFSLLDSPTFIFTLQSNLGVVGLRMGRSVSFGKSRFGLNLEASVSKIVPTRNPFGSN